MTASFGAGLGAPSQLVPEAATESVREPLSSFLATTPRRTGDPFEAAALAELAGYSAGDALDEGWPDLFSAARSVPGPPGAEQPTEQSVAQRSPRLAALRRGLTYTAPVIAMWAIFPDLITGFEARVLALVTVLAWGASMAMTYRFHQAIGIDPARAWQLALRSCLVAVGLTVTAMGLLVELQRSSVAVAALGVLQVGYFFSANALLAPEGPGPMGRVATGAAIIGGAGIALDHGPWADAPWLAGAALVARVGAALALALPMLLLVRARIRSGHPGGERSKVGDRRSTSAFAAYGTAFGALALWAPAVEPESQASVLLLAIVVGLALAEVAVVSVKHRARQLLAGPFEPGGLAEAYCRVARRWLAIYLTAVAATAGLLALSLDGQPDPPLVLACAAVVALGAVQFLSLLALSLNGVRAAALSLLMGAALLLLLTAATTDASGRFAAYLGTLLLLAGLMAATVRRLAARPVNYL